jgi:hypothetical protein
MAILSSYLSFLVLYVFSASIAEFLHFKLFGNQFLVLAGKVIAVFTDSTFKF